MARALVAGFAWPMCLAAACASLARELQPPIPIAMAGGRGWKAQRNKSHGLGCRS